MPRNNYRNNKQIDYLYPGKMNPIKHQNKACIVISQTIYQLFSQIQKNYSKKSNQVIN